MKPPRVTAQTDLEGLVINTIDYPSIHTSEKGTASPCSKNFNGQSIGFSKLKKIRAGTSFSKSGFAGALVNINDAQELNYIRNYNETDHKDAEIMSNKRAHHPCVLSVDGNFKAIWDLINTFLIGYILIFLPFKISFVQDPILIWEIWDAIVDIFFFIDLIIMFFTPYYGKKDIVIYSHKKIACNYL